MARLVAAHDAATRADAVDSQHLHADIAGASVFPARAGRAFGGGVQLTNTWQCILDEWLTGSGGPHARCNLVDIAVCRPSSGRFASLACFARPRYVAGQCCANL